jgi:hypothetical protein
MSALGKIWKFLGSLAGAAVLLLVAAAVSAVGALYTAIANVPYGTFFGHPAYLALMAVIGLSIAAGTVRRVQMGIVRHAGFLLAHLSLCFIAAGAVLTAGFKVGGTMYIAENSSADKIVLPGYEVRLYDPDGNVVASAGREGDLTGLRLRTQAADFRVEKYFEHARKEQRVAEADENAPPAIELEIKDHGQLKRVCLEASPPDLASLKLMSAVITYTAVADEAALDAALADKTYKLRYIKKKETGQLVVTPGTGGPDLALPDAVGTEADVPGTPYRVRILANYPNFRMGNDRKVEQGETENPALQVRVTSGSDTQDQWLFALHPEWNQGGGSMHGGGAMHGGSAMHGGRTGEAGIGIYQVPGQPPVLVERAGGRVARRTALLENEPVSIDTGGMPLVLQFIHAEKHGRIEEEIVPAPKEERASPAVLLSSGNGQEQWIFEGAPMPVSAGYKAEIVERSKKLDFKVHLDKFEVKTYPGSRKESDFVSTIRLERPDGSVEQGTVSMNRPLAFGEWRLCQYASRGRDGWVPGFEISRDPGAVFVYIGYVMLAAGVLVVGYINPLLRRRASSTDKEAPHAA